MGLHQLWVQIQLNKNKSIIVCVTYKPPNCPVACIKDELKPMLIEALMMQPQIVIMGDLNCNLLNNSSVDAKALLDTCNELNLKQIIEEPTRITAQTRSLLDVIMITPLSKVKTSGVMNTGISDHCLVYCTIKVKTKKPNPKYINVRSYKRYDPIYFKTEVAQLPLHEIYSTYDVNSKLDLFNELFLNTLNKHAPMKYAKIKGRPHKFIGKEIKELMKIRDRHLESFRKSKNSEDWNRYKQLRNTVKISIKKAESEYVCSQIEKNKDNSKSMWKVIRGCLPSKETTKPSYRKDPELAAEEFNNFFISVGKTTADKVRELADQNNILITSPSPRSTHVSDAERFKFSLVTREEVRKIILKSPSNKAPGPDKVSVQCFKDTLEIIIGPVTDIINCSLMTSTYPISWKLAEVIPLHKDGDPDDASNNRPVSLLSSLSKICDKVVLNQFTDYLLKHKLLTKHQSGNRKWHSTETLNIAVTDTLLEAIDKKQLSFIIFLDLSKAFDSVQHNILINKIMDLGVTTEVLNWFKSYLSNRSQYVRIGAATSTCAALKHGIPQGSVLSPFLFNIYTDSLPSVSKSCNLESFVDDSKTFLTFPVSSINCSIEAIEDDLQRIFQWCCNHSLLINPEKTKMLIVGSRQMMKQIQTPPNINFISKNLIPITEVKDLGVFLDSFLSYDKHIQALSSSCISKLGQINRVKNLFDQKTLAMIIDTLVMSKINYCSSIWSNTSEGNIEKIQLVQNYAARIISGEKKFDHISPTISALGWLPIKEHLLYRDILLMFKCVNGQAPLYFCDKFKQRNQVHHRDTRSNEDLDIPKF